MVKYDFGVWNDNRFIGFQCYIKVKVGDMFYKEFMQLVDFKFYELFNQLYYISNRIEIVIKDSCLI